MKLNMKKITSIFLFLTLIGCSNQEPEKQPIQSEEQFRKPVVVLARVNGTEITQSAFELYKKAIAISEPNLTDDEILDKLIDFELVAQKAKQEGYNKRADIASKIHLQENELLSDIYIKQVIANSSNEVLLMAEYEKLKKENGSKEMLIRHIMADTENEIQTLKKQVESTSFEQVANNHNQNNLGGLVGWVTPAEMIEPIRDVLLKLPIKKLSNIIKSNYGYHLVWINEVRTTEFIPFDSAKPQLRSNLVNTKMKETLQSLRKAADVEKLAKF